MEYWHTNPSLIDIQEEPSQPYFKKAYALMRQWKSGAELFTMNTSGSTGTPKEIILSRAQLASSAKMTGAFFGLGAGSKVLVCLNISYIGGFMMLVRGMELGWELTIVEPSSNPLLGSEMNQSFDFISMVPMQFISILNEETTFTKVKSTGVVLLGGAPVGADLIQKIKTLNVPVYLSYGMTETVSHIAVKLLNAEECDSSYRVMDGVRVGVDDRGCLWIEGSMTNQIKVQTNDMVEISGSNTFEWLGRLDNMINSGGVKISLDKIDQRISGIFQLEDIQYSYFSWYEVDAVLGQKLVVFVEATCDEDEKFLIFSTIRKHLVGIESPKHAYFVKFFKRTPTDKIDKRSTADIYFKSING